MLGRAVVVVPLAISAVLVLAIGAVLSTGSLPAMAQFPIPADAGVPQVMAARQPTNLWPDEDEHECPWLRDDEAGAIVGTVNYRWGSASACWFANDTREMFISRYERWQSPTMVTCPFGRPLAIGDGGCLWTGTRGASAFMLVNGRLVEVHPLQPVDRTRLVGVANIIGARMTRASATHP